MVRRKTEPVVWSFDELQPAGLKPELGAAKRHDPYYSTIHWPYPLEMSWLPPEHAAHLFHTRPRRYIESVSYEGALDDILSAGGRTSRHTGDMYATLLGAVHGWKTCTPEQLAALTGREDLWSGSAMPYARSIAAGLVELGVTSFAEGRPKLLRASQPWAAHDRLLRELSLGQLLAVTGGGVWATGPDTPRHNILATELALRVAELCDIATVLTEEYSRLSELAGPPTSGDSWTINPRAAADFTIVRRDGLRIAVEVTATTSKNLERKIHSYARMFDNGAPELVVIFLLAPSIDPEASCASKLRGRVQSLIESAIRMYPGTRFAPSADCFGVSSWGQWFPQSGFVAERFFSLTAARPSDVTRPRGWSPADFLDAGTVTMGQRDAAIPARPSGSPLMVVELAKLRGSTPHWLRGPLHADAVRKLDEQILHDTFGLTAARRGSSRASGSRLR